MTIIVLDQMRSVTVTAITPTTQVTVAQTGMQGPQGNPTTVNGKTGASITLTASDVGAVASSSVGVANGVASLDSSGEVPSGQINVTSLATNFVDLSTSQSIATGVKTFGVSPIVPTPTTSTQAANKSYVDGLVVTAGTGLTKVGTVISLSTPVSILNGGTGSATQNFVDLTTNQTIAGNKTLSGSTTLGNQTTINSSNVAGALTITQLAAATSNPGTISVQETGSGNSSLGLYVAGDTVARYSLHASGTMNWGPGGSTAQDLNLYRSAAATLKTDNNFSVGGTVVVTGASTLNAAVTINTGTNPALKVNGSVTGQQLVSTVGFDATTVGYEAEVSGDSINRLVIRVDGSHEFGSGAGARDAFMGRSAAQAMYIYPNLVVGGQTSLGDNGVGELQLKNAGTVPSSNPSGGGILYAKQGVPQWRDPQGQLLQMVKSYFVAQTADVNNFTTETDLTGATQNVEVTGSNATVNIEATFDCALGAGAGTINGILTWNGVDQAAMATFVATAAGQRATVTQQWQITGVTASTYVAKLRATCTTGNTSNVVRHQHTNMSITVLEA
jgi:hypothetical protein